MVNFQSNSYSEQQFKKYHLRELLKDTHLAVILLGSLLVGLGLSFVFPSTFSESATADRLVLLNLLLLYPLVEELLFRGVIQEVLLKRSGLAIRNLGISYANCITSILFVGLHFIHHPPVWAIAVFIPSLVLGYMRERYISLLVPISLHMLFNAIFLLAGILSFNI
jgi:membrane protease YdiL (CAAX protease family)